MSNLITAEQAKELLKSTTPGTWRAYIEAGEAYIDAEVIADKDEYRYGRVVRRKGTGYTVSVLEGTSSEGCSLSGWDEDIRLAAAAPSLAHTVIAQDARIKELEAQLGEKA